MLMLKGSIFHVYMPVTMGCARGGAKGEGNGRKEGLLRHMLFPPLGEPKHEQPRVKDGRRGRDA